MGTWVSVATVRLAPVAMLVTGYGDAWNRSVAGVFHNPRDPSTYLREAGTTDKKEFYHQVGESHFVV